MSLALALFFLTEIPKISSLYGKYIVFKELLTYLTFSATPTGVSG